MSKKLLHHITRHKVTYLIVLIVLIVGLVSIKNQAPDFNTVDHQVSGNIARVTGNQLTFTSAPQPSLSQESSYEVSWTNGQRATSVYLVPENQKAKPILLTKTLGNTASVTIDNKIEPGNYSLGIKSGNDLAKSGTFSITPKIPKPLSPTKSKIIPKKGEKTPNIQAPIPFELPVMDMSLADYLDEAQGVESFKIDKDSPTNSYQEPSDAELNQMYEAMRSLLSGNLKKAKQEFSALDYELKYLTNNGKPLIAFEEVTKDDLNNYEKGWGGGVLPVNQLQGKPLISTNQNVNVVVWTPHTTSEQRIHKIGHIAFETLLGNEDFMEEYNVGLLFNTSHRSNASKAASQGGYRISDFSRHNKTPGKELQRAVLDHVHGQGKKNITLNLHGFSNEDNHPEWLNLNPIPLIVMGDSDATSLHQSLAGALRQNFPGTMICGVDWDELCGDLDELQKIQAPTDIAIHAEMDTTLRDTDAEATSIAETIAEKLAKSLTD